MLGKEKLNGFFVVWTILSAFGEKLDDGCGHSMLGPESGVLSSKNYPGTYPNNTWCEWKIRVPEGNSLVLRFGDLDVEARDCQSDYVKVLKDVYGGEHVYGTFCGSLKSYPREVHTDSNEVIVQFRSGRHISGRGFLFSYSSGDHRDLLTCLDKGSHFSDLKYRKYCPAGCKAVAGDISGDISQGYRHTSVLCKAAVHAGVILDELGGWVSVETHKGLSHYHATRANGIQSKDGSLSEALFTFLINDCKNQSVLQHVSVSASSWGEAMGCQSDWAPNSSQADPGSRGCTWTADQNDSLQWLQLDLGEKKRITGIITTGSTMLDYHYYVRSFKIVHKERSRWRTYTQNNSTQYMIFEGNQDSLHQTRNTFHNPIIARYLRIIPQTWHQRIVMRVELLGCTHVRGTHPNPHVRVNMSSQVTLPTKPKPPVGDEEITEPVPSQADRGKLAIIIVPIVLSVVLLLVGICVFKMLQKKKTKENSYGSSDTQKTGCWKQIKQPFARHQSTEFTISYSSEKDPIQKLDLVTSTMAEYQQPLMIGMGTVTRKGSTFRPMDTETKEDPSDPSTHYNYLHTANQYALPLTNQEPEYATPIIERHTFHKDGFLPDPANYCVPGFVLSKTPSFKTMDRKAGVGSSGGYQTPQVKTDRGHSNSEGVYDSPKVNKPVAQSKSCGCSDYQRPQAKPAALESYSTPRDCVRVAPAIGHRPDHRPDPEGSSGGT
ncbi:discoidin, CUB and LCCL domain-containing protein 1 isoform X1 [Oncorhynchus tshawytscha]|uniref:Discoidin, CUB and LCCL domain containing 1 n=1 Tax=Oncorhynchus tshawytscha TaxID=74940 RepID=A0A8C8GJC2_ONCTS|nr:discoidin, CUB and LCCL domain-containing protein 1 isoform X1 [Oncorhynchus tshawytscha]